MKYVFSVSELWARPCIIEADSLREAIALFEDNTGYDNDSVCWEAPEYVDDTGEYMVFDEKGYPLFHNQRPLEDTKDEGLPHM